MPQTTCIINYHHSSASPLWQFWSEFTSSLSTASGSSLLSWTGTSAIDIKGSILQLLPITMERESIFCRRRVRRCFWAFLFLTNNAARIKPNWIPLKAQIPNRFKMTFTTNARAGLRCSESGMELCWLCLKRNLMVATAESEKNLAMISDKTMEAAVRLAYIIKW